jgi:hypothetical protein
MKAARKRPPAVWKWVGLRIQGKGGSCIAPEGSCPSRRDAGPMMCGHGVEPVKEDGMGEVASAVADCGPVQRPGVVAAQGVQARSHPREEYWISAGDRVWWRRVL